MRRAKAAIASLACTGLIAAAQACATDASDPENREAPTRLPLDEDALAAVASAPAARVLSVNDRGDGRVIMAPNEASMSKPLPEQLSGEQAARLHLARYGQELGLSEDAIEAAELHNAHELRNGGAIYQFSQRVNGTPVFGSRANVVMDGAKNLISLTNNLVPSWVSEAPTNAFALALAVESVLGKAYAAAGGPDLQLAAVTENASIDDEWYDYRLSTPLGMLGVLEAAARRVLYPESDRLVAGYHVELMTRSPLTREIQGYGFVIAGDDGRVLWRKSLTANEKFTYRVWADTTGNHTPMDGPIVDATPHPTSVPETFVPPFAEANLIEMEGFNKNKDPWLEPDATVTFGNNVQAYSDRNQGNGFFSSGGGFSEGSDYRGELTSPLTFDRKYDLTKSPDVSPEQIMASVTQVFYVTNWLHDYFYDSGFDEKSGNAQVDNIGRGGQANDPLLAEAQDSADNGTANNANMSTPADGRSPRMQMYVWSGTPNRQLVTVPPVAFEDWLGGASFGGTTFNLQAKELVLSNDGSTTRPAGSTGMGMGTVTDACQQPTNVSGKIAVIDRGVCTFTGKVQNAQTAGAIAALIINNAKGHTAPTASQNAPNITIPVLMLSFEDGEKLKKLMLEGTVQASTFSRGAEVRRDGSIDSTVVAHEWGHYIHMRLQTGQSLQFSGMSEGWGDFNSLFMSIREGDTFANQAYPMAQYAAAGFDSRSGYYGIRRAPYSVEYTINPFTFRHIGEDAELPTEAPIMASPDDPMNESHAVGEIWAQMLFEVYVNILEVGQASGRPFDESKRRMADYMVASLKGAPDDPTFVEARDAMLAAARAMVGTDPTRAADVDAIARGFAKRGLGAGAVGPASNSNTLTGVRESYVIDTD